MFHRCTRSIQVVMWKMFVTRSGSFVPPCGGTKGMTCTVAAVKSSKRLGVTHQSLFHKVGKRPNQKHTSLREGEVTQHGEEEIAELAKEATLHADVSTQYKS
jgi:hypothetical protein